MRPSNAIFAAACTFFVVLLSNAAFAQRTVVWKGGTPGQETNWHCPKNWSTYRLPDEFSNVVIPDLSSMTQANPIIRSGMVEVNALRIESRALLTIATDACLVVHDYTEGINAFNLGPAQIPQGQPTSAGQQNRAANNPMAQNFDRAGKKAYFTSTFHPEGSRRVSLRQPDGGVCSFCPTARRHRPEALNTGLVIGYWLLKTP